jgi:hypothetical protein
MSAQDDPQPGASAPKPSRTAVQVAWFTGGMVLFGMAAVASLFVIGSLPIQGQGPPIQIAGVILLLLTAGAGIFAIMRGNVALGSGLLVGYGLATIFSAGQCTLWAANPDYGLIQGFLLYLMMLGLVFVIFVIAVVGDAVSNARRRPPAA